jgi:hypothetical protein
MSGFDPIYDDAFDRDARSKACDGCNKPIELAWTAVFWIAFVIAIAISVAALLVQSDRIRYP